MSNASQLALVMSVGAQAVTGFWPMMHRSRSARGYVIDLLVVGWAWARRAELASSKASVDWYMVSRCCGNERVRVGV